MSATPATILLVFNRPEHTARVFAADSRLSVGRGPRPVSARYVASTSDSAFFWASLSADACCCMAPVVNAS